MDTFSNIIHNLGGPTAVARSLGLGDNAVDKWVRRDSIHSAHWPRLIQLAAERGLRDVTLDRLSRLSARSKDKSRRKKRAA